MKPTELIITRGKSAIFTMVINTVQANGAWGPANIANASAITFSLAERLYHVANAANAGNCIFQKTLGNGLTLANASNGNLQLAFLPSDTWSLCGEKSYYWDAQVYFASTGGVFTFAAGTLAFNDQAPINLANQ